MKTTVDRLPAAAEGDYAHFVENAEDALFYHELTFTRFLAELLECEPIRLIARQDGKVVGVLPVMKRSGPFGAVLNSLPFYGSNGGVLAENEEAGRALISAYSDLATDAETAAATLISHPFKPAAGLTVAHTSTDHRISQYTRLSGNDADRTHLMDRFDPTARRNVRKAEKEGVVVERCADALETLESIHHENMEAIGGRAKPARFFQLLPRYFRPEKNYDLFIARKDGEVIAALLLFYGRRVVEYYIPATRLDHRNAQPLALIIATAMQHAARRGFTCWNWGGTWTSQDGVYRFKKKWGTDEGSYTYFVQVNAPEIRHATPDQLLEAYPGFYVIPFDQLEYAP